MDPRPSLRGIAFVIYSKTFVGALKRANGGPAAVMPTMQMPVALYRLDLARPSQTFIDSYCDKPLLNVGCRSVRGLARETLGLRLVEWRDAFPWVARFD